MHVRARCMMPNYDFSRTPAAFYSSSGSKNSAYISCKNIAGMVFKPCSDHRLQNGSPK